MSDLPDPPVRPETNLKGFDNIPFEIVRLRKSKAWLIAKSNPALAFYMINLWMASWLEVPAGSLEDDDAVLADAAMCSAKRWPHVRDDVMRHWVKCSDGRLYHPVVCEKVAAAWSSKKNNIARAEAGARGRWVNRDASSMRQAAPSSARRELVDANRMKEEEKVRESKESLSNESDARASPRASHSHKREFEIWWEPYPHKVGKDKARKAYERALTKTSADQLTIGVERYKASKPPDRPWCNPATWLNEGRWTDQPAEVRPNGATEPFLPLHEPSRRPTGPPPERL